MNIYFDSDILCNIYLKNGEKIDCTIQWSYLMTKFINELYTKYEDNWDYFESYYSDSGNPYGKILNTEKTLSLKSKELEKSDFDSIVLDDFYIDCELFLKSEPYNPRYYTITKQDLLNKFVKEMNDLHGKDWSHFNTFFNDTEQLAYGVIINDANLKKRQKLTWKSLKFRRYRVNKEKWDYNFNNQNELFYILFFKDSDFIKIGHTFRGIEYRLYNYIFPKSTKEKELYQNRIIDFEKSFIVKTNIKKNELNNNLKESLESIVKTKFKQFRFIDKKYGNSKELLRVESFAEIQKYFSNSHEFNKQSIKEYSGFKDSIEMKKYNIDMGVSENALNFYDKKNKPTLYIKTTTNNV